MSDKQEKIIIAYDGDCPFCSSYVHMQRLQNLGIDVSLVNFRDDPELVETLRHKNLDPNNGMYVKMGDAEYYADEAVTVISSLTTSKNIINLGFKWWFKNRTRAKILYPVLRTGRNLSLKMLGKSKL
ncbi:MAG: DUF393 domain-containing protein [Alphaproteobacteria bacterium]|nr:DUF393 domain-containing protein [Alphaproteobacteria bacterium]